jgi:hypothetical protein
MTATPDDFLAFAKRADAAAAETKGAARKTWQKIANEYRAIAAKKLNQGCG